MKNLKRIATLFAVVLLTVSMLMLIVSCGDDKDADPNNSVSSTAPSATNPTSSSQGGTSSSSDGSTDSSNPGTDNPDNDNPNLVTVKVVDQNGNPIKGAEVQICQESCFSKPIVTGNDGTGSREYTLSDAQLKARVRKIDGMDDYLVPATEGYVYFKAGERTLTITIRKVEINVFDQLDKAVEGAAIQLAQGEHNFNDLIYTDADGIASAFIAVSGEALSATVTEILSEGEYDLPSSATEFDIGAYDTTIVVDKLLSYSVKIATMMGNPLVNAKVELYDVEKNRKQKTVYTDENGIAKFENMDTGNYYVKVSHQSPAYVITTTATDGKYMFPEGSTSLILEAVDVDVTYTVTLSNKASGVTVYLYDKNNELYAFADTDENGVASIIAKNGDYVAVVKAEDGFVASPLFFQFDGVASGEITISEAVSGTQENPLVVVDSENAEVKAGETLYILIPNPQGKVVSITKEGNLVYTNTFESVMEGTTTVVEYTPETDGTVEISVIAPGTHTNPIDINANSTDINSYTANIVTGNEGIIYYSYTASADGTLIVDADGLSVYFEGAIDGFLEIDGKFMYPMTAGETVIIDISTYAYNEETELPEIATVEFGFGEQKTDYSVVVSKDGEVSGGVNVILYSYVDGTLTEIAKVTTNESGVALFTDMAYAGNYVVKVEYPEGYTSASDKLTLGANAVGYIYLTRIKTGTSELPFDFDAILGEETAEVKENGTVWYTIFVRPSFDGTHYVLTANSANAVITVYYADTNEDGTVDENDTPVGVSSEKDGTVSYAFTDNNKVYKIAVSTKDGSAETINLEYASVESQQGATIDTAIEITEGGNFEAKISGSPVYYRFAGSRGSLTVTVNGESVKLQTVEFAVGGETTVTDALGNTFTTEDTEGNWIYFVISADTDGAYSFTVTYEAIVE